MSKWQPIETAPKDGTEIMVWVVKRKKPRGCLLVWFDDESNDWVNEYGGIRFDLEFTHWMPLPEAPVDINNIEERGFKKRFSPFFY